MNSPALAQFGTFDVENYGDLLYPVIFEKMLAQRGHRTPPEKYSLRGGNELQNAGYATKPVRELFAHSALRPQTLVIGGGDLLRTDWRTIASHYVCSATAKGESFRPSLWRKLLLKALKRPGDAESEFRRRYLSYPRAAPFILRPERRPRIQSVVYCSCGVPFALEATPEISGAFNDASFIYVRDKQSRDALQRAGVSREIHLAPDLIVVLSDFFDADTERERGRKILCVKGADPSRRKLIFQSNVQPPEQAALVIAQLRKHQARTGCEVILLPIGKCLGDCEHLKMIATMTAGAFRYVELDSIFDMMAVIAAGDVFLGTSLHGNITAFSFGIPHLFGPIAVAKRNGFLEITGLPEDAKLDSWADADKGLNRTLSPQADFFKSRAEAAKKRVHATFDAMCRALCV